MKIKVCGMREADNVRAVEALGIDLMGFICYEGSPRHVAQRPAYLPEKCERVGVFVDPEPSYVREMAQMLSLTRIQLHSIKDASACDDIHRCTGLSIGVAISVHDRNDIERYKAFEQAKGVDLLLFDTKTPLHGGSGEQFDWSILAYYDGTLPFLIAGGIGPADAKRLRTFTHPRFAGIDLNSRFESAPAMKDITKLTHFLHDIKQ